MLLTVFQSIVGHCFGTMSENSYRYVTLFSVVCTICADEAGEHDIKFSNYSWTLF